MLRARPVALSSAVLPLSMLLAGCAAEKPVLRAPAGDQVVARELAQRKALPHGIDGDRRIVFVAEPLAASVAAIDHSTGREVGLLPPPPGGFVLPFSLRVPSEGHLVVLDSGGFPDPKKPAIARVHDYEYSYTPQGGLTATLARTVRFDDLPLAFAEDVEVLPGGSKVVADSILGQLWVIHPDGKIAVGLGPRTLSPADAIPSLAPCPIPDVVVDGVTFRIPGNMGPGVNSLAQRDGYLYFGATCAGGVHRVPTASLTDGRTPDQRAADIAVAAPKMGSVDVLHGLAFNRWDPGDPHLYAADSLRLRVIRIKLDSGQREVLAEDPVLFNFPVSLQFLPPEDGVSRLVVSSDQEHRFAAINSALTQDAFQPPFRLTKVLIRP